MRATAPSSSYLFGAFTVNTSPYPPLRLHTKIFEFAGLGARPSSSKSLRCTYRQTWRNQIAKGKNNFEAMKLQENAASSLHKLFTHGPPSFSCTQTHSQTHTHTHTHVYMHDEVANQVVIARTWFFTRWTQLDQPNQVPDQQHHLGKWRQR